MCLTTKYTLSESTRHSKSKQFSKGLHIFMPGAPVVSAKLYPMALLGGKSSNRLKNLKPFIMMKVLCQNSQLVAVKCKNLRQQELMVKELEQGDEEKNFFFADPRPPRNYYMKD